MIILATHGYYFLLTKMKLIKHLLNFVEEFKMKKGYAINNVRSDKGREFDNQDIELYCDQNGFGHNFSAPRTP
jgi:hypothetical protein